MNPVTLKRNIRIVYPSEPVHPVNPLAADPLPTFNGFSPLSAAASINPSRFDGVISFFENRIIATTRATFPIQRLVRRIESYKESEVNLLKRSLILLTSTLVILGLFHYPIVFQFLAGVLFGHSVFYFVDGLTKFIRFKRNMSCYVIPKRKGPLRRP